MNLIVFRRLSFTGLSLFIATAIIEAVLPKNDNKKINNGRLVISSDGGGNNTCKLQSGFNQCTYTATLPHDVVEFAGIGSRTSSNNPGNDSSSITTAGRSQSVKTITQAIVSGQQITVNNIHTSADNGANG